MRKKLFKMQFGVSNNTTLDNLRTQRPYFDESKNASEVVQISCDVEIVQLIENVLNSFYPSHSSHLIHKVPIELEAKKKYKGTVNQEDTVTHAAEVKSNVVPVHLTSMKNKDHITIRISRKGEFHVKFSSTFLILIFNINILLRWQSL